MIRTENVDLLKGMPSRAAEFVDEPHGWIKWLRGLVEDSERAAAELAKKEMERIRPEGRDVTRTSGCLRFA